MAEIRAARAASLRNQLRTNHLVARCRACGACPKHIAKLPGIVAISF